MNIVILKGRLTATPELKRVGEKQTPMCEFTVAVNRRFEKDTTDFINCQLWSSLAEFVTKYFTQGKEIAVVGELHIDKYEKDGEKRSMTRIKVNSVEFCGSKSEDKSTQPSETKSSVKMDDFEAIVDDDDLPFM